MPFQEQVIELLYKYHSEYQEGFLQKAWETHEGFIGYGFFESYVAYCLVREYQPKTIIDIGCACGFSTYPLAFGVNNNHFGQVYSLEINCQKCKEYKENMEKNCLSEVAFVRCEDATKILPFLIGASEYLINKEINHEIPFQFQNNEDKPIDLLFIDANHEAPFAEWYLKELVPKTKTLLHVHDIAYLPEGEETQTVLAWLDAHPEYEVARTWELAYEGNDNQQKKPSDLVKKLNIPPPIEDEPDDPREVRGEANSSIWVKLS